MLKIIFKTKTISTHLKSVDVLTKLRNAFSSDQYAINGNIEHNSFNIYLWKSTVYIHGEIEDIEDNSNLKIRARLKIETKFYLASLLFWGIIIYGLSLPTTSGFRSCGISLAKYFSIPLEYAPIMIDLIAAFLALSLLTSSAINEIQRLEKILDEILRIDPVTLYYREHEHNMLSFLSYCLSLLAIPIVIILTNLWQLNNFVLYYSITSAFVYASLWILLLYCYRFLLVGIQGIAFEQEKVKVIYPLRSQDFSWSKIRGIEFCIIKNDMGYLKLSILENIEITLPICSTIKSKNQINRVLEMYKNKAESPKNSFAPEN